MTLSPVMIFILLAVSIKALISNINDLSEFDKVLSSFDKAHDNFVTDLDHLYDSNNRNHFAKGLTITAKAQNIVIAKIVRAIAQEGTFTMAYTGTSVTECGDNFWNASYAHWVETLLSPIAKSTKVNLVVRNVAEGANEVFPYDYCIETFAGADADIITWEQDMMCPGWGSHAVEAFIQNAFKLPRKPTIMFSNPGPNRYQSHRSRSLLGKWLSLNRKDLRRYYEDTGFHSLILFETLNEIPESDERFTIGHLIGDGKLFGNAGWHPGPYGHQVAGYQHALAYATLWKKAMEKISYYRNEASTADQLNSMINSYITQELSPSNQKLSPALDCKSSMCISNQAIQCASTYEPRGADSSDILDFVVNKDKIVDLRSNNPKVMSYDPSRWTVQLWKSRHEENTRGSPSKKYVIAGNVNAGELKFSINIKESGHVILCETRDRKRESGKHLKDVSIFKVDGHTVPLVKYDDKAGLCVWTQWSVASGKREISIVPTEMTHIELTHIVWT